MNVETIGGLCEKCPDFNPVCADLYAGDEIYMRQVCCEHIRRCRRIVEQMQKNEALDD